MREIVIRFGSWEMLTIGLLAIQDGRPGHARYRGKL
jgi:hypothetical protein